VALHELSLLGGEAGAERRHDLFDPGEGRTEHIEVPLDQDRTLRLTHRVLRDVQVVQQLSLVEDRRIGGIEILGLSLAEDPATEGDHAAAQVVDREEQPAAEAGCERAILPSSQETRLEQHLVTHAQPFHCVEERLALGRIPEPERLHRLQIQMPSRQVIAGDLRFGALEQLAGEPVSRRGHGAVERLARIGTGRTALRNGNPHPTRHLAYGGGIIHAQLLHEERENVPTRVAHETVEHPLARDDGEVAVGAPVKRTRGAEIGPGALELDVLPDDPYDVRGLADLLDHVVGDEAHARNSTSVTPWPPWFGGANPKRFTRGSAERTSCTNWRRAPVPLPWTTRR